MIGVGACQGLLVNTPHTTLHIHTSSTDNLLHHVQDCPHVMDKLRSEQQALVAKHGERITPAVLKDMTYADAVIK